jgi:3-dehydrosphinganine reductase
MSSIIDFFFRHLSFRVSPFEVIAGATAFTLAGCLGIYAVSLAVTPSFDYNEKHVLITGGSSGIGLECAKLYAKSGANVTIVARDKKKLDIAVQQIKSFLKRGREIVSISVDTASSEENVSKAFSPAVEKFGSVDVLLNCAGTSIAGEFNLLDPGDFERMMKINVLGTIFPTRAVLPSMKQKKSGRIVFVSSQVAQAAIHGYTAYGASKWVR